MIEIISWIISFAIAITIHEAAHAYVADKLGDPTARLQGRLSLNPLVHYDRVGTTLLLVLVLMRSIGTPVIPFGWAKAVPIDPYNLKNPRRDSALISLAGPLSNISLSAILSLFIFIFNPPYAILLFLIPTISLNVVLAVFNLIPIHPLDGGKILVGLLPQKDAYELDMFLNKYGFFILMMLIFPFGGKSAISFIISPILTFILSFLVPSASMI